MKHVARSSSCCDDFEDSDVLSVDTARERILAGIDPIHAAEKSSLRDALGRVLAEDIISPLSVPGHTNSAMDGYALAGNDLPDGADRAYQVIGNAYAGTPFSGIFTAGQCVRIMTGAVMPDGTDTVIMQEHVEAAGADRVRIGNGHRTGQNVRLAGEDIKVGDDVLLVIRPETVSLSPSHGTERPNTFHGIVESQMYAGNLAKYTVKFGNKEMVVDHYNPMGSEKFSKNDKVKVTVPRSIHVLKR